MGSNPTKLSASRGAAILGLSEYQTPFHVWQRIMESIEPGFNENRGYIMPEYEESAMIRYGNAFESAIISLTEAKLGSVIEDREKLFTDDYLSCHVDGIYQKDGIIHEGKTTNIYSFREKWGEEKTDAVPQTYQIQAQHVLMLTGAPKLIISVLIFPERQNFFEENGVIPILREDGVWQLRKGLIDIIEPLDWAVTLAEMGYFRQYEILPNRDIQYLLRDHYAEFWNEYVLTKTPPEPKNYDDLKRLCPSPKGTIVATEQLERWAVEYRDLSQELGGKGMLSKRKDELKLLILDTMRKMDPVIDDESREKTILLNSEGKKIISWNGKMFR